VAVAVALAVLASAWRTKGEEAAQKVPQTTCPVMDGQPTKKDLYVDYQGQRIYFCCRGCPAKFLADPEKYFAKIEAQNVLLESVQKNCPVTGEPISKKYFTDHKGQRIYFCCPGCIAPFKSNPKKYLDKLQAETAADKDKGK
jgi:YHS domain-containing protein